MVPHFSHIPGELKITENVGIVPIKIIFTLSNSSSLLIITCCYKCENKDKEVGQASTEGVGNLFNFLPAGVVLGPE